MTRDAVKTTVTVLVVLAGLLAVPARPVMAEGAPAVQAQPPADAQNGFVPVKDLPQQEKLPAAPLVMAAYAFVWAVLLIYVWTVWRRLMKVEGEVKDLNARLAAKTGRS